VDFCVNCRQRELFLPKPIIQWPLWQNCRQVFLSIISRRTWLHLTWLDWLFYRLFNTDLLTAEVNIEWEWSWLGTMKWKSSRRSFLSSISRYCCIVCLDWLKEETFWIIWDSLQFMWSVPLTWKSVFEWPLIAGLKVLWLLNNACIELAIIVAAVVVAIARGFKVLYFMKESAIQLLV
jgi:hypothetical protein